MDLCSGCCNLYFCMPWNLGYPIQRWDISENINCPDAFSAFSPGKYRHLPHVFHIVFHHTSATKLPNTSQRRCHAEELFKVSHNTFLKTTSSTRTSLFCARSPHWGLRRQKVDSEWTCDHVGHKKTSQMTKQKVYNLYIIYIYIWYNYMKTHCYMQPITMFLKCDNGDVYI